MKPVRAGVPPTVGTARAWIELGCCGVWLIFDLQGYTILGNIKRVCRPASDLPFGQGPRLCIGREFALGEMVLVLDELLREHRVDVPTGWQRPEARAQVAVHPRGGMPLLVTRHLGGRA